jgi:hypothetical protein
MELEPTQRGKNFSSSPTTAKGGEDENEKKVSLGEGDRIKFLELSLTHKDTFRRCKFVFRDAHKPTSGKELRAPFAALSSIRGAGKKL